MIFYRRRKQLTTPRAPGELPPTKILWRNTAIAWGVFAWGMIFAFSLRGHDLYIRSGSTISELVAVAFTLSEALLFALIAICIICGALFGGVLLLTSTIATLHRSWRIDDSVGDSNLTSSQKS